MGVDTDAYERAVIEQLNAEAKLAGYSVKSLAAKLGRSYDTFRNYMLVPGAKGQVAMPLPVFLEVCEAIGISRSELLELAERRMNRG